jgi:hypothetical protein
MKHPFLIFIFLCLLGISSYAQPYQGPVQIINTTDCEILWNVVAVCPGPPCQEYSTGMSNLLEPYNPDIIPYQPGYISYTPDEYPWSTGNPPCSNWTWAYATVYIIDYNNGSVCFEEVRVGLFNIPDCNGEDYPQVARFNSCTCNGQPVTVGFAIANPGGIATLNITQ